ncbi:MAG: energy transducer TonB [Flavobacteriaceae bacterium]|jgi:hypothetical protein|nr:energy transducer TonB [Flavobacteriaceae bacterium]
MTLKKIYIVFVLLCTNAFAQENTDIKAVGYKVEQKAVYPGTDKDFRDEFQSRFRIPDIDWDAKKFQVILMFIVEVDGTLTDIRVARDPGYGLGREAIRVLKSMGKWIPALQNGTSVQSKVVLLLPFSKTVNLAFFANTKDALNTEAYLSLAYYEKGTQAFRTQFSTAYKQAIKDSSKSSDITLDVVMTVHDDGRLSSVSAINTQTNQEDITAVSVIMNLGKWLPGRVDLMPVDSKYRIQVEGNYPVENLSIIE